MDQVAIGADKVISELASHFGGRLSTSATVREQHANIVTWHANQPPDAVVEVKSVEEIATIVKSCAAHKVPVIAYGAGTSLEGHLNAPFGGISIDVSAMNEIIEVNEADLDARVQPGVTRKQLNEYLRDRGLFFPIDPGADATLGGMAATRASGTNAVRYGTMRENVLSLKAVMADGTIIDTGTRARKSAAGYDLTHLLVGSEGTLGVFGELVVRLHGIPEAIAGGLCSFETVEGACETVITTIQMGIPVARIELVDPYSIRCINAYSKLELAEQPTLFVEFHGSETSVAEQAEMFGDIAGEFGGGSFTWATKTEDRNKIWQARHDAYWATLAAWPGRQGLVTDACVPISQLATCVTEVQKELEESNLQGGIVGHVGDGNFHVMVLVDPDDKEERQRAESFVSGLSKRAIALEGTCTGEHGIGQGKITYLRDEYGPGVDFMKRIKTSLDPDNIFNPGKIFASN